MKVKAYKAYNARKANELSLNVDDIIEVEDKTSIDLWKGKLEKSGETGLFPTNCVVPLDDDISPPPPSSTNDHNHNKPGFVGKKPDLLDNLNDKKSSTTTTTSNGMFKQLKQVGGQKKDPAPAAARGHTPLESSLSGSAAAATAAAAASAESAPKLPPKPVREQVRVIYGYKAQNEDELTIKEGEIITVISRDNEDVGWWKGELNGRIALFPDNFVEMIQPSPPPPLPRPAESDKLRIRKPDRGSPSAGGNSSTTTNSTSPAPSSDSANPNTFASSVPIIGKMIKGFGNQSNHKSSDTSQSSSVNSNGPNKLVDSQSSLTTEGDAKEDPFNAEPLSPSKLVHLTAQRPKIPSNQRRPPSLHLGKPSEFPDFMDTMEDSSPSEPQPPPKKLSNTSTENNNTNSNATNKIAPSSIALKPVVKPEPDASSSPEKKAPWLSELKKSQERRRTNELLSGSDQSNRKSMNGPPAPAPSSKPHAPNPPTAKPFVSNSTKPSLVSPQTSLTANNTTNNSTTANNISPSSDHSPTNQQQQPQQHGATEASSIGHKSVSTGPVTISTNSSSSSNHHHHSINENVAPSVQSVNSHPSVGGGVTSSSTASTITSTTTIVTNSNSNNSNNSNTNRHVVSTDSSSLSSSSPLVTLDAKALAARDEEMAKMRSEVNQLTETVAELRTTVTDLRKELAHQAASQKSAAEWAQQKAELDKQIHEQHSLFESHKKNLSDMVKELINELTEEKKKIAALQIELDRMRKLTTTV